MNKKLVFGSLCTIIGLAFLLSQNKPKTPKVEMSPLYEVQIARTEVDANYESYLEEFQKRVVARSESQNFKCEIINSGKGGCAYNAQKSKSFMNSIFYIGDAGEYSPLEKLQEEKMDEVVSP